ncbi:MAG: hypothetical protein QNJ55_21405 [Xenococcus sp. MO_188.B8]|nr:hypothetical protein [Xenococcus sp. MO_188.B8]
MDEVNQELEALKVSVTSDRGSYQEFFLSDCSRNAEVPDNY